MLRKKLTASFWNTESSGALCRSMVDLVLFDRLAAHQEEVAARQISLHGEYAIVAHCRQPNKVVSGNADYALGYEPQQLLETRPRLESSMIIVEAKRKITFETGIAQAVIYMGKQIISSRMTVLGLIVYSRDQAAQGEPQKDSTYCIRNGIRWRGLAVLATRWVQTDDLTKSLGHHHGRSTSDVCLQPY